MSAIKHFTCPACQAKLRLYSSRMVHPALREQYASCTNPYCGASYKIYAQLSELISPAGNLFQERVKFIPQSRETPMLNVAREFVGRERLDQPDDDHSWTLLTLSQQLVSDCCQYLRPLFPNASHNDLTLAAHQAVNDQLLEWAALWQESAAPVATTGAQP